MDPRPPRAIVIEDVDLPLRQVFNGPKLQALENRNGVPSHRHRDFYRIGNRVAGYRRAMPAHDHRAALTKYGAEVAALVIGGDQKIGVTKSVGNIPNRYRTANGA